MPYCTENGWDGGVFEISVDGGPWTDILAAGGSFAAGGYDAALNVSANRLGGRPAWNGQSDGTGGGGADLPNVYKLTTVNLPASANGKALQRRGNYDQLPLAPGKSSSQGGTDPIWIPPSLSAAITLDLIRTEHKTLTP